MLASWALLFILALLTIWALQSDLREHNCPPKGCKNKACHSGNGSVNYLGRGSDSESIEILLSRIDWVADAEQRSSRTKRSFVIAFIILLILIPVLFQRLPKPNEIVIVMVVIFVVLMGFFGYFNFHSVLYSTHYIHQNVDRIRSKLGLEKVKIKEVPTLELPHPSEINVRINN